MCRWIHFSFSVLQRLSLIHISMVRRVVGVVVGSIIYRAIYAAALRANVPADYMKLVSAIIVGLAIAAPSIRRWAAFQNKKRQALAARKEEQ